MPVGAEIRPVGGTLLPGLRDAHVHLGLIDPFALTAGGIAAVDDLGGTSARLAHLWRQSLDPASGLPEIRFAGAFLTAPGGYPSDRSWAPPGSVRTVQSVDDAELAVGEQLDAGATGLKVTLNSTAGPVLGLPVLRAIVESAHGAGGPVVAHVEGPGMLALALDAGVDRLAHVPWTEPLDAGIVAAAARQQDWITTLAIHAGTPALPAAVGNLRAFLDAGGRAIYGTDLGNGPLPVGINRREITVMLAAGMAVDDVLTAMTDPTDPTDPTDQTAGEATVACHLPGPLDRDRAQFSESLSQARVLTPALADALIGSPDRRKPT